MGGEGKRNQRIIQHFVPEPQSFFQIFRWPAGPGAGKIDQDHAEHGPQAATDRPSCGHFGKEVHIVETGHTPPDHFRHG